MSILLLLLLFILTFDKEKGMADNKLLQIINNLNNNLNIEFNLIIIGGENNKQAEYLLKNSNKTLLIKKEKKDKFWTTKYTNEIFYNIYQKFSSNLLTIVFVDMKNNNELKENFLFMANVTKYHLRSLHFTDILWITQNVSRENLYDFSHICWDNGFYKVLFYNNTLFYYERFPYLKVEVLPQLHQYYQRKDVTNFQAYPFKLPITNTPPRCYRFTDRKGQHQISGYMFRILEIFMEKFNFTFVEYPYSYSDFIEDHLPNDLHDGIIDAVAFLTYRNRSYDSSTVIKNGHVYMLVPNAKPIPKYKYFQKPFHKIVWLLHCIFVVVSSLLVAGLLYGEQRSWDISKSFILVFSMVINQNHFTIPSRSKRFNVLYIMFFVYGIIMINYYLCVLSSLLVSTLYEDQVKTLQDIEALNLPMYTAKSDVDYYRQLPSKSPIIERITRLADSSLLDSLKRNLNTSCIHPAFEDKLQFYMFQQRYMKVPRLRFFHEVLYSAPIFFTFRHNLPYIQLFNRYLHNVWASGLFIQFYMNIEWQGILSGQIRYIIEKDESKPLLTLEYFYSPLILYVGGIVISLVVFLLEIWFDKWYRNKT